MNKSDETTYQTQSPVKEEKGNVGKVNWQKVTIGGITGILMGAAATHVADDAYASDKTDSSTGNDSSWDDAVSSQIAANGLRVAEVDQNLSFGDAFAAARAEVGAGGVFHWHGRTYNTYTEREWTSMSEAEHNAFAHQVAPELSPNEVPMEHQQEVQNVEVQSEDISQQPQVSQVTADSGEEPEVHFLGIDQIQTENGQTMNIGHMTIASEEVALVDLDNDMVFDVTISDRNHNGQIEDEEVIDISDRQLTVTDFALAVEQENGGVTLVHDDLADNPQDLIAEDMPDYMNNVDMQDV